MRRFSHTGKRLMLLLLWIGAIVPMMGCPSSSDSTVDAAPKTGTGPEPTPLPPVPGQPSSGMAGGAKPVPAPAQPTAAQKVD